MYTPASDSTAPPRRAFLVGVALAGQFVVEVEEHLDELAALAESAGAQVVGRALQPRKAIDAATFVGSGKAREIASEATALGADLVIFDDDLSGAQVKAIEAIVERQVLDRSGLILELFHQRARSREAKTQVDLAQANYLLPRLTRRWRHLSRQVGGIGVRGGEGETQLEADRRVLRRRIAQLSRELKAIERTRALHRRSRRDIATVALAGYTNAGKSTLFNRLTHAGVPTEDRLFATLDARVRRGSLAPHGPVVLFADTVGFIRKLPHHLVASFRGTLEEVVEADLVLHVVDRSHPGHREQRAVAEEVLRELGVEAQRELLVLNKVDRLSEAPSGEEGVAISAATGEGLDRLKETIARRLAARRELRLAEAVAAAP